MSPSSGSDSPESRVERTPCPRCGSLSTVLGTLTERFVYLRCGVCQEVWAIPERRRFPRAMEATVGES